MKNILIFSETSDNMLFSILMQFPTNKIKEFAKRNHVWCLMLPKVVVVNNIIAAKANINAEIEYHPAPVKSVKKKEPVLANA